MTTDNRLRLLIERYERLLEERRGISDDLRDVLAEAKAVGYDGRTFRALIARRAMKPEDRAESDALLQTYEAALGMDGEAAEALIAETRPDLIELASAMLAEQLEGLEDPAQAAALVGHVLFILDLRAEIALLRAEEAARRKLAKAEGFEPKPLQQVVRWIEKVAKHGAEAMRLGEVLFQRYRASFEARPDRIGPVSGDEKLAGLFQPAAAKVAKPSARSKGISEAEVWSRGGFDG
jgi:uncharacterized protein (UPF0335 family)